MDSLPAARIRHQRFDSGINLDMCTCTADSTYGMMRRGRTLQSLLHEASKLWLLRLRHASAMPRAGGTKP